MVCYGISGVVNWRLENLDALVTFGFEDLYEGGARQFLSARARGDSRQEGTYSCTLLYQWLINDDASIDLPCHKTRKKKKATIGCFPASREGPGKEECGTISITLMRLCLTHFLALEHWERQETTWYGR